MPVAAETGEQQIAVDKSGRRVRSMFASIARRYDLLNHLLSLNVDRRWRRVTVRLVPPVSGDPILDCCTGTADLALEYWRASRGKSAILGADFCREMLVIGREKIAKRGAGESISLVEADARNLPLPSGTFGVVSIAFGLRNVSDTRRGLDELIRVLRPGGRLAVLEFSRPRGRLLGGAYLTFFRNVLPRVGQALAPNGYSAYRYLPDSVLEFPDGEKFVELMVERGLESVVQHRLTGGIATLYIGVKPAGGGSGDE